MVSIWKTFRSMRDGRCRESGRSSEARCREVPLYIKESEHATGANKLVSFRRKRTAGALELGLLLFTGRTVFMLVLCHEPNYSLPT